MLSSHEKDFPARQLFAWVGKAVNQCLRACMPDTCTARTSPPPPPAPPPPPRREVLSSRQGEKTGWGRGPPGVSTACEAAARAMALAVRREREECAALSGAPSSPLPALLGVPPLPALNCMRAVRLSAAVAKLA